MSGMLGTRAASAGFEGGGRGFNHGMQAAFRSWERQENELSPRSSRKKCSPSDTSVRPVPDF